MKTFLLLSISIATSAFWAGHGHAQEQTPADAERQYVKTNLADDFARCRTFFVIGQNENPGPNELVAITPATDDIDTLLIGLVGVETAVAKLELWMDTLAEEMDRDYAHFSRLIVNHGEFCSTLMEDPQPRFEYWQANYKQLKQN